MNTDPANHGTRGSNFSCEPPNRIPHLVEQVRNGFRLNWHGIHGAGHWARVAFHGRRLAKLMNVDPRVPQLFALLHDSQRRHDGRDPEHGSRAADFVAHLHRQGLIELPAPQLEWLIVACRGHSEGMRAAPTAIQICWDADRLDLGRVGIRPDPARLCTNLAKDPAYLEFAWRWSRGVVSTTHRVQARQPTP